MSSGLDFPGNVGNGGPGTIRFRFTNVVATGLPLYPATYIWRAYPRQQSEYYTTFFWANDDDGGDLDTFRWHNSAADTYYGAHPFPDSEQDRTYHEWEIACRDTDIREEPLEYNRWFTQAFRAWEDANHFKVHEFYWDLASTSNLTVFSTETPNDTDYGETMPPSPCLTWGDAPWNPGNEVYSGIIRGIQVYNALLTVADIQTEAANHTLNAAQTTAGQAALWYINQNPTPTDISDKKSGGTAHNPAWVGANRPTLWSSGSALEGTPTLTAVPR